MAKATSKKADKIRGLLTAAANLSLDANESLEERDFFDLDDDADDESYDAFESVLGDINQAKSCLDTAESLITELFETDRY